MARSAPWRFTVVLSTLTLSLLAGPLHYSAVASGQPITMRLPSDWANAMHIMRTRQTMHPDSGSNLVYHGGPVMRMTSIAYTIFWQPSGVYMSPTYKTLIDRYFTDVGGSALYGNNTQYYDTGGNIVNSASLGGTWTDTAAYPSSTLNVAQVILEILKAIHVNHWSTGITHAFFLYLGKGENMCIIGKDCSFSVFCAFHAGLQLGSGTLLGAVMPYAGTNLSACGPQSVTGSPGPNNDPDADAEISVTSHEQMESVTDPLDLLPKQVAWRDPQGQEIGDKCNFSFGPVGPDGGNITINGHRYVAQQEWSNAMMGCTLGS